MPGVSELWRWIGWQTGGLQLLSTQPYFGKCGYNSSRFSFRRICPHVHEKEDLIEEKNAQRLPSPHLILLSNQRPRSKIRLRKVSRHLAPEFSKEKVIFISTKLFWHRALPFTKFVLCVVCVCMYLKL